MRKSPKAWRICQGQASVCKSSPPRLPLGTIKLVNSGSPVASGAALWYRIASQVRWSRVGSPFLVDNEECEFTLCATWRLSILLPHSKNGPVWQVGENGSILLLFSLTSLTTENCFNITVMTGSGSLPLIANEYIGLFARRWASL